MQTMTSTQLTLRSCMYAGQFAYGLLTIDWVCLTGVAIHKYRQHVHVRSETAGLRRICEGL